MQCERDCEVCNLIETCMMQAAIDYRTARYQRQKADNICAQCPCHASIARRLAECEEEIGVLEGVIFGLAAFFEKLGGEEEK